MEQVSSVRIGKRAYRIRELKALGGPGHDRAYKLINQGVLRAVKDGRNTLILADDFERFLASRPAIAPKVGVPQSKDGQPDGRQRWRRRKPRESKGV